MPMLSYYKAAQSSKHTGTVPILPIRKGIRRPYLEVLYKNHLIILPVYRFSTWNHCKIGGLSWIWASAIKLFATSPTYRLIWVLLLPPVGFLLLSYHWFQFCHSLTSFTTVSHMVWLVSGIYSSLKICRVENFECSAILTNYVWSGCRRTTCTLLWTFLHVFAYIFVSYLVPLLTLSVFIPFC